MDQSDSLTSVIAITVCKAIRKLIADIMDIFYILVGSRSAFF